MLLGRILGTSCGAAGLMAAAGLLSLALPNSGTASDVAPTVRKTAPVAAVKRPNMIVIMGDDIGYSDIGAFGGEIDTPNLDALAARSVKFSNFYNMSRCCPSRASLLTGRYPHRVGMGRNGTSLSKNVYTVAEELRGAGYATSMVGKWHLTAATPLPDRTEHLKWLHHQAYQDRDFGDRSTYPAARGFQHHWGIIWGVADYYDPFSLVDDFTPVKSVPKDFYLTDAITDHAVSEVARLGKAKDPYFLYLAYTAAHWPLMAPAATIDKYLPRYAGGWDQLRTNRYARQVKLGLVEPKVDPLPPLDHGTRQNDAGDWDALTPAQRAIQVRKMATHAAMIETMDRGIGKLIAELKASGQYENTVIVFLIDNGASPEMPSNPGYDRSGQTRDGRTMSMGMYPREPVGTELSYTGIGARWANAANTPWRYWKAESYQGGTHTPFMVSWPGHLAGREGKTVDTPAHVIDVTPTLLDLAHVAPHLAGKPPMDGKSLAGVLTGAASPSARPLFFEHYRARAVIDGRWKLVSLAPGARQPGYRPWMLYDLATDRTETRDVGAQNPQVVAKLDAEWTAWARDVGAEARSETGHEFD